MPSEEIIALCQTALEQEIRRLESWLKIHSCLSPEGLEKGDAFIPWAVYRQNCRSTKERLADDRAALERIEKGPYGICVDCGQEINLERLMVIPCASRCTSCQEKKGVRIH